MFYIIGVNHALQYTSPEHEQGNSRGRGEELIPILTEAVRTYSPRVIAEEFSEDAINRSPVERLVCRDIAEQFGLQHVLCDPTEAERRAWGILGLTEIDHLHYPRGVFFEPTSEAHQADLRRHFIKREEFWLNKLYDHLFDDVLIVIGGDHIPTFTANLDQLGIPHTAITSLN